MDSFALGNHANSLRICSSENPSSKNCLRTTVTLRKKKASSSMPSHQHHILILGANVADAEAWEHDRNAQHIAHPKSAGPNTKRQNAQRSRRRLLPGPRRTRSLDVRFSNQWFHSSGSLNSTSPWGLWSTAKTEQQPPQKKKCFCSYSSPQGRSKSCIRNHKQARATWECPTQNMIENGLPLHADLCF